ncbi:unnamed protein product [Polarella glacialis]|uniref:Uncharacterized protein n=1 Tax=Polarella glacialis TaxID=89957 RepID=A0A813ELH2_POLGL|nr:unnamed protein product [Polarella glacialis]
MAQGREDFRLASASSRSGTWTEGSRSRSSRTGTAACRRSASCFGVATSLLIAAAFRHAAIALCSSQMPAGGDSSQAVWRKYLGVSKLSLVARYSPGSLMQVKGLARHRQDRARSFRRAVIGDGEDLLSGQEEDWRDFRARLVQQELAGTDGQEKAAITDKKGWAYQTDLLEQGSLLLSAPGDYWSLRRQYFCKVVMLVIRHDEQGSVAVVLNRPTGLTTANVDLSGSDLVQNQLLKLIGISQGSEEWNVWFGGDCEGMEIENGVPPKHICLHTLASLADESRQIIKGVFVTSLSQARTFVSSGRACKDDFMLLIGYTGWSAGQLQGELDRGGSWILGAADQGLLLGSSGDSPASLTLRLKDACAKRSPSGERKADVSDETVGDGIFHWQRLYEALRPGSTQSFDHDEEAHNDEMIRRWVELYLNVGKATQSRTELPPAQSEAELRAPGEGNAPSQSTALLRKGTLLRGSATKWLLGRPAATWPSRKRTDAWTLPGQYLHKAVILLLEDAALEEPSTFVLLNGPKVGEMALKGDVLFGGVTGLSSRSILPISAGGPEAPEVLLLGRFTLPPSTLQDLLELGAVEVVEGVQLGDVLKASPEQRWQVVGGTLDSWKDVQVSRQGDRQRRKWLREVLGIEIDVDG